jgi:hypothetical protein
MKTKLKKEKNDDLRPEYNLKLLFKDGVQGKYSERYREGTNSVLLDPDVQCGAASAPCQSTP